MKSSLFGRSNTATAEQAPDVDELVPLEQRRARLHDRLRTVDADIAELLSDRTRKLLAGDDVTGPIGTGSLREERGTLAAVVATLDGQIATIKTSRAAAERAAAQKRLDEAFEAARANVDAERVALHAALKDFLFSTWPKALSVYETAASDARRAASAAGQPNWYPGDRWRSPVQGMTASTINDLCRADPNGF